MFSRFEVNANPNLLAMLPWHAWHKRSTPRPDPINFNANARLITFYPAISISADTTDCEGNYTQTLYFSYARNETQCVSVSIRGDNIVEDVETFVVIFSSDDERDEIVYDNTTVSIVDDDGEELW